MNCLKVCGNKSNKYDKNIWWNIIGKGSFSFGSYREDNAPEKVLLLFS